MNLNTTYPLFRILLVALLTLSLFALMFWIGLRPSRVTLAPGPARPQTAAVAIA